MFQKENFDKLLVKYTCLTISNCATTSLLHSPFLLRLSLSSTMFLLSQESDCVTHVGYRPGSDAMYVFEPNIVLGSASLLSSKSSLRECVTFTQK